MAKLLTMPERENLVGHWSSEGKLLEMPKPRDPEPSPGLSSLNYWTVDNLPPYAQTDDGA